MTYGHPKRPPNPPTAHLRETIRAALQNDAKIWAIMADDDAECERSLEVRLTKAESKQIYQLLRDLLQARNGG